MVISTTRPDLMKRYFMRVKAWPLPGLTYSVSVMTAGSLLTRIFMPFLTSFMPTVAMVQLLDKTTTRHAVAGRIRMGRPPQPAGIWFCDRT